MSNPRRKSVTTLVVGALMAVTLALASCGSGTAGSAGSPGQGLPVPSGNLPKLNGSTFTYWYGLIFSPEANQTEANQIRAWGRLHHVNVEPVPVNQNDLVTKVSAALVAHKMPDALDMSDTLMIQLNHTHNLANLMPLYNQLGQKYGGWLPAAGTEKSYPAYGYGIPYGAGGNVLYRRKDLLAKAGYTQPPATWAELEQQALKAQDPPNTYGMGFALSNVGDGEGFVEEVLHDYGARIANDAGSSCTLDTPATRDAVSFLANAYSKNLFPSGNTIWDGAGDNNAYQSGKAIFIANTGSVTEYMSANDPKLNSETGYSALPGGPKMRVSPVSLWSRVIPAQSKNAALAESLIQYLSQPSNMDAYYKSAIYGPTLKAYANSSVFDAGNSAVRAGLKQLAELGTTSAYPDVENTAYAQYATTFQASKMVQAVVVDHLSVSAAVSQGQAACEKIYSTTR